MDEVSSSASGIESSGNAEVFPRRVALRVRKLAKVISTLVVLGVMGVPLEGCQSIQAVVEQSQQVFARHTAPTSEQRVAADRKNALAAEVALAHSTGVHAANACERFIKRRLRDPESIRFPTEPDSASIEKHLDGAYRATVEIHAIDRDDGATISYFDCEVVKVNEDWMLARLREHVPS